MDAKQLTKAIFAGALAALAVGICAAQTRRYMGPWQDINASSPWVTTEGPPPDVRNGELVNEDTIQTAREIALHSSQPPNWTNAPGFEKDVFTFARGIYAYGRFGANPRISGSASPWGWITDFPDSDLNLSYRLQQMTSLRVNPDGRVLKLSDPNLSSYPWLYMVEPGRMELKDDDVPRLRKYLLNGGVLMVDDFWGQKQWDNFEYEIKRALPEGTFTELPMDHPIFHCVFDIKVTKNELQTPNSRWAKTSLMRYSENMNYGITWETYHDDYRADGAKDMHVRALLDAKGRIMVIATHNCDNGDGWEREGEDDAFFHTFSERRAFPLGINIIFYLMTH